MYPVSEAYKTAMKERVQHTDIAGTVGDIPFTRDNILYGSFSITNQCAGSIDMEPGCVYVGELQCTFRGLDIPRHSWAGREIRPVFRQLTSDGWEEVPLGVFTVEEANWTRNGIQVTAYDNMSKFDDTAQFAVSTGKAYDFLEAMCGMCHVDLGMSQADVEAMPNGNITLGVYADNDISTWRDMLSYLAAAMGAFATIDRSGRLVLRLFSDTAIDDLDDEHRFMGEVFSDFETKYSGIYVTDVETGDNIYYGGEGEGLVMSLGANPFLQYGAEETLEMMGTAIADALGAIDYVPFKVTAIGNPAYDLGDVFVFSEGLADGTKLYCLMKYVFKYNGNYEMQGVGSNPALMNAKSKLEKEMAGLVGGREADKIYFYSFENVEDIEIPDGKRKRIIFIRFMTKSPTHVVFRSEVCAEVTTSGECVTEGTYYLNNNELWLVHPKETMGNGQHTLHYLRDITSGADGRVNSFAVWVEASGGDVFIPAQGIKALLWGQGLVANTEWDGVIECYDDITVDPVGALGIDFTDDGDVDMVGVTERGPSDSLHVDVVGVLGLGFTDASSGPIMYERFDTDEGTWTYDPNQITISNENFVLTSGTINAYLYTADVTLGYVTAVKSHNSGALFAASFDGGSTWLKFEGGSWSGAGAAGMDTETMEAISAAEWAQMFNGTIQIRAQLTTGNTLREVGIYGGGYT